jgi:myosin-5
MFLILAALLHLGNVEIVQKSRRADDDSKIRDDDTHLPVVARLLKVDPALLAKWLVNRKLQTGKEVCIPVK